MAFLGKVGGLLKQTVGRQVDSHLYVSNPSHFQAIRWMSSSKLFIGGLSYSTDDTGLQESFSPYGQVIEARVIVDRESGRSRGFGFVTFTSGEEASSAIQAMDGQDLHGRRVRVAYATDRARGVGGGYGGGSYGSGGYGGSSSYSSDGNGSGGANYGGNYGGGYGAGGYGGSGGSYGTGGYGGESGNDGNGSGGANYAGGYGGGNYGVAAAGGGGSADFGVPGGVGGNVTGDTSFASSGFQGGSGLGYNGGGQFSTSATSGMGDSTGNYEPNELLDSDVRDKDDEPGDYARRAR